MKTKTEKIIDYSKDLLAIPSIAARQLLKYRKSGSLLDLGAGRGRNTLFLAKKGFDVTALDSNKSTLIGLKKAAKERGIKVKVKYANMITYNPQRKYDVVLSLLSVHFLSKKQISKTIEKIKNYTKAGGLNVITVHTKKNKKSESARKYLFKKNELKKHYKDWKILEYREVWGQLFKTEKNMTPVKKHRAEIIARKPR